MKTLKSNDRFIVDAIIGDIRQVPELTWDYTLEEIEPTEEELWEFDNPVLGPETKEEDEFWEGANKRGMKLVRWFIYKIEMEKMGLPYLDRYEYMNTEPEPEVPSDV
jgi:hypothetical protein